MPSGWLADANAEDILGAVAMQVAYTDGGPVVQAVVGVVPGRLIKPLPDVNRKIDFSARDIFPRNAGRPLSGRAGSGRSHYRQSIVRCTGGEG